MYVLKYRFPCPEQVYEFGYEEGTISVKNGVAVVSMFQTRDYLCTVGYDLVGEIDSQDQVQALLAGKEKDVGADKTVPSKLVVSLEDVIPAADSPEDKLFEEKPTFWWQEKEAKP